VVKLHVGGRDGLANFTLDGTEMIHFNFIHDSGHVNVLCLSDQPGESVQKAILELTFPTWILTQDTQLVFNSNWHSTSSQVTHN